MAGSNYDFDTSFAKTISLILGAEQSLYSSGGHALLENISIINFPYGKQHVTRTVSSPYDDVSVDRRFAAADQLIEKEVQDIDFVCLSKRVMIDAVDYAADPTNVARTVADSINIVKDGVEKFLIEGNAVRIMNWGIKDPPATGNTTINRCDTIVNTAAGDWDTITNAQADIAASMGQLIAKGFYGPFALLAPTVVKPMFALVQTSTAVPVSTWVQGALGIPVYFSPHVDSDATAQAFDCYLIDTTAVHLGMSDMKMDAYYSSKDHCFNWDIEVYMSALFDPQHDGTDYLKGVCTLLARDWIVD